MRLSPDEIQFISRKIVKSLVAAGRLEVDDEGRVIEGIARVIVDELSVEEEPVVARAVERAVDALFLFVRGDLKRAMNLFNRDEEPGGNAELKIEN